MSRIFVAVVVAVLLFGGTFVADQALQNPELEPTNNTTDADQQQFVEGAVPLLEAGVPVVLFSLVVGAMLAAVRAVGGG